MESLLFSSFCDEFMAVQLVRKPFPKNSARRRDLTGTSKCPSLSVRLCVPLGKLNDPLKRLHELFLFIKSLPFNEL